MTLTKQNYVLVDYENVRDVELERITALPVKVVLFVGQNQKLVPVAFSRKKYRDAGHEVVESVASGKNALDFQMACYAGRIAEKEPKAFIHFVSKDKGFDFVVQYLKKEKRFSARADSFSALKFLNQGGEASPQQPVTPEPTLSPAKKPAEPAPAVLKQALKPDEFKKWTLSQRIAHVLGLLAKINRIARPRKVRTLQSSINAMFSKQLDETEIKAIIDKLISDGKITVGENGNVTYCFRTILSLCVLASSREPSSKLRLVK